MVKIRSDGCVYLCNDGNHLKNKEYMANNSESGSGHTPPKVEHEFRYYAELAKLPNCPPPLLNTERRGFRFASADKLDPRNFLPVALMTPARLPKLGHMACCSAYALSMYDTRENLIKKAKLLLKSNPKALKTIGDHFLEVSLDPQDGRHSAKGASGHFDFHSYTSFKPTGCVIDHGMLLL